MSKKSIIVTFLCSLIVIVLIVIDRMYKLDYSKADTAYLVYLNGENLGLIKDDQELYDLINKEQDEIKNTYNVENVYPPTGFELVEVNTFNNNYLAVDDVYDTIETIDNFTIKGYVITIKSKDEEKKNLVINVLNKDIFTKAINNFVLSFIDEAELNRYLDGDVTIEDVGSVISKMYFNEVITIKEGYISVHDKIYTDVESLSQFLLFGPDTQMDSYTVKLGDDIASISEKYMINPQEFLIANPTYHDENTILRVGAKVNVTLIDPVLTLVYEVEEINENITKFTNKNVIDNKKEYGYSEITTAGVDGLSLDHISYQVVNGEASSEVKRIEQITIREMVEQITTKGPSYGQGTGNYTDIGGAWGLPTNSPFYVTSRFGWRSHKIHYGVDISGTGYNSPIYAVGDGTVVEVASRATDGYFIIIQHENNVYTQYAHLAKQLVTEGQKVSRGDRIGLMGNSGLANGTHVHFGVSIGWPYHGSYSFQNPANYISWLR